MLTTLIALLARKRAEEERAEVMVPSWFWNLSTDRVVRTSHLNVFVVKTEKKCV